MDIYVDKMRGSFSTFSTFQLMVWTIIPLGMLEKAKKHMTKGKYTISSSYCKKSKSWSVFTFTVAELSMCSADKMLWLVRSTTLATEEPREASTRTTHWPARMTWWAFTCLPTTTQSTKASALSWSPTRAGMVWRCIPTAISSPASSKTHCILK